MVPGDDAAFSNSKVSAKWLGYLSGQCIADLNMKFLSLQGVMPQGYIEKIHIATSLAFVGGTFNSR